MSQARICTFKNLCTWREIYRNINRELEVLVAKALLWQERESLRLIWSHTRRAYLCTMWIFTSSYLYLVHLPNTDPRNTWGKSSWGTSCHKARFFLYFAFSHPNPLAVIYSGSALTGSINVYPHPVQQVSLCKRRCTSDSFHVASQCINSAKMWTRPGVTLPITYVEWRRLVR